MIALLVLLVIGVLLLGPIAVVVAARASGRIRRLENEIWSLRGTVDRLADAQRRDREHSFRQMESVQPTQPPSRSAAPEVPAPVPPAPPFAAPPVVLVETAALAAEAVTPEPLSIESQPPESPVAPTIEEEISAALSEELLTPPTPLPTEAPATEAIASPAPPAEPAPPLAAPVAEPPAPPVEPPPAPPLPPSPPPAQPGRIPATPQSFEERFGTRWVVWAGGVALALGGIFLVQYSIQQGWLGPAVRILLGGLFAAALLVAGEWERRREMLSGLAGVPTAYIPGVLTAAGTVVAFGTVYAAYVLYGFIAAPLAFLLLGAVALATLAAALIHGPALAGLGLAGAYVTPALVASETPNYWALVVYLAIVSAAALALASARRWRWLAIASVALGVLWTFPGIGDAGALPAHLFHVAAGLALVAIFVVSGLLFGPDIAPGKIEYESSGALAAYLAAGAALVFATSHDPVALVGFAAMVAATLAIAWRAEAATLAVPAAALLVLLLFLEWSIRSHGGADLLIALPFAPDEHLPDPSHLAIGVSLGALFGGAGLRAQGRSSRALVSIAWSASGALLPILLLMTLYWAATNGFERALAFALAGLAAASLYSAATEGLMRRPPRPGSATAAALYATAAVAALALTLTFSLDRGWLSVGLALMVPGIAWVHLRRPLPALRILAAVLVAVVTARTLWEPRIIGEALGSTPILNWLLYGYGVPAGAFWLAGFLLRRRGDDGATRTAESGAIVFTVLLFFLEIRHFLNGGAIYRPSTGLTEVALQVSVAVALAIGLERVRERTRSIVHNIGAVAVAGFAVVAALVGLMLLHNPLWTSIDVGGPFANLLLLAYLLPAALFAILERIIQSSRSPGYRTTIGGMSVGLAFLYLSLEVGRLYRGPVLTPFGIGDAEFYTYPLVWLAYALGVSQAGRITRNAAHETGAVAIAGFALLWLAGGFFADHNLTTDGTDVGGLFVNLMAPAFLAPALLLVVFAATEDRPERAPLRASAETAAVALGLVYLSLELMRFYRGPVLSAAAMSDAEYYSYPVLWLVYAIGLAELGRRTGSMVLDRATSAIAGLALMASAAGLFIGRNLATDGIDVGGLFLNLTALAYLFPAFLFAILAARERHAARAVFRGAAELAGIVLALGYLTLEVMRFYRGPILSAVAMTDAEFYTYPVLWLACAVALSELRRLTRSAVEDRAAEALAALAVFAIAIGWIAGRNLATDGTDVGGLFINLMIPAYLAPAILLGVLAEREERLERKAFHTAAEIGTLVLAVAFLSLEVTRFYRGPVLADVAMSDAEYYSYPLLWLACAVGLTALWRRRRRTIHDIAAVVMAVLAVATIGVGFLTARNLWTDMADVGGLILNAMLAGFLGPAVLVGILARGERRSERAWYRIGGAIVAVALMFLYLSLEVTRFHRGPVLAAGGMSDAELYSYSAVWLAFGVALLLAGIALTSQTLRLASAAMVVISVGKVFLIDLGGLTGGLRALSFIGLGLVLVGIGWLYQRLLFPQRRTEPTPPT